jgi:hypothetical protein
MVAYSFKSAFVDRIYSGSKLQTVRRKGAKRHARPGEPVQIYQGLRTRNARKIIPDPTCVGIDDIEILVDFDADDHVGYIEINGKRLDQAEREAFAWADGFISMRAFGRFWWVTHGAGLFEGVVIRWEASK